MDAILGIIILLAIIVFILSRMIKVVTDSRFGIESLQNIPKKYI